MELPRILSVGVGGLVEGLEHPLCQFLFLLHTSQLVKRTGFDHTLTTLTFHQQEAPLLCKCLEHNSVKHLLEPMTC